jgi:nitroreductase
MTETKSGPIALEDIEHLKHAPPVAGIPDLLLKRWSPRAFADREVAASDLEKIFLAAGWAASSYNEQPWRFLVGRKGDETYKKIFDSLVEFNQMWAKSAPVLVLSAAKKTFSHNASANKFGLYDTGAASALLMLQAIALGLHTHSMAGFDSEKARASFGIPEDYEIGAVTALGYLGDPNSLPDQMREKELEPRTRKPVAEFVFSEWETAAKF